MAAKPPIARTAQPYEYRRRELVEPDWTRFPGWRTVTAAEWASAQWQRAHCVKSLRQLHDVLGDLAPDGFYADLERDQQQHATMSMLLPPQMLNTMVREDGAGGAGGGNSAHGENGAGSGSGMGARRRPSNSNSNGDGDGDQQSRHGDGKGDQRGRYEDRDGRGRAWTSSTIGADPVRRYMLPLASDRHPVWPSHPRASRDSLHEHDMWVAEGLTHRYPTKVLAELTSTCPQYCGHCTRMDLVGTSTPSVTKLRLTGRPQQRYGAMLDYLRRTPGVRDVVVSGGDVANVPWRQLESFLTELLTIESVRDVRLATKALMGLPQHWLQADVLAGMERVALQARRRGVSLAVHTHVNTVNSLTPTVARASKALLEAGVRDVRNQGVLMRGVNDSAQALLDLSFALLDEAMITPYYFYMCDMIPASEHWRVPLSRAQDLQHAIMGYLPGFATPRIVCDVPYVGKRWVHQAATYDRVRGVSTWTKNYRTSIEGTDGEAIGRGHPYFDPIDTLPEVGQRWWADQMESGRAS
ncbi:KamA family radical SAM protein [Kineosporia corallincola]